MSIRATSSSSAISRVSRSASAFTVVSISFFWSSLSLSHRLSSAWHEALDAGQRRAQLVGDGGDEVGALAVEPGPTAAAAQTDRDADDPTEGLLADQPRRGEHLVAERVEPRLLGDAARDRDGVEGPVDVEPGAAVLVEQPQHVGQRQPLGVFHVDAEQCGALGVEDGDHALAARAEDAVGVEVRQRAQARGPASLHPVLGCALVRHERHPRPALVAEPGLGPTKPRSAQRDDQLARRDRDRPCGHHGVVRVGGHVVVVAVPSREPARRARRRRRAPRRRRCRWPGGTRAGPSAARQAGR